MSTIAPEISVIIPVYNGERYLAESIQSVLDQQHPALEILVISNGSTDATPVVAQQFSSIRYYQLEEKGLARALNLGVENSRGIFLAFIDADDLWTSGRLAAQLEAFDRNPAVEMVFGHIEQFISPELEEPVKARLTIRDKELPGRNKSSMLIRKSSFMKVGLFEQTIDTGDFIDWYMRAEEQNLRQLMLRQVVTLRRIHGANMGYTDRNKRIEYVRVIKRGLDRRRRMGKG